MQLNSLCRNPPKNEKKLEINGKEYPEEYPREFFFYFEIEGDRVMDLSERERTRSLSVYWSLRMKEWKRKAKDEGLTLETNLFTVTNSHHQPSC